MKYISKNAVRTAKNAVFLSVLRMTLFVSIIYVVYIDTRIMSYSKAIANNSVRL